MDGTMADDAEESQKSAHRFALSPIRRWMGTGWHWCRASAQTVVWMRCWRSVPFLGQPMDGWEKGGGGRGCDGGVGRPSVPGSRQRATTAWESGRRRVACQAARAVGRKHTGRSRRWMRMRQTREGPAAVRTGTRARSLVVVGRSVEGGRGGRWSSTGHSTATVEVKCGGGRIERQVHGSFGGLARRPGESQGAKPYGKHQRKWIATLLSAAVFFKEHGPEHGHMDNHQVCRSTRTATAVPSNTSLSGLGWCDTPPS